MRILHVLLLWILLSFTGEEGVYSQTTKEDVMSSVLKSALPDTSKVITLDSFSRVYIMSNNLQAGYQYATEALALAKRSGYKIGEAISLYTLAFFYAAQLNYADAKKM